MKKNMPLTKIASLIFVTLSVTACARFDEKTQAEGSFEYQTATLNTEYKSGQFTRDEQRDSYVIPALTDQQEKFGLLGADVDIRPPTQLMALVDGVVLDPDAIKTKVWFNAFKHTDNMEQKVWALILDYLVSNKANSAVINRQALTIETGDIKHFVDYGRNEVLEQADYSLAVKKAADGRSASLTVNVNHFQQFNDGKPVKQILAARTKHSVEVSFINDLLRFAYTQSQQNQLKSTDNQPLPIQLGFDDNHQTAWVIGSNFENVWNKLPTLLTEMSFESVQDNKNLGYFLVKFVPQQDEYWTQKNLNPINLEGAEYYVQLGELSSGETSVIWLDADKKMLSDQQINALYLSITNKLRHNELLKRQQKNAF